MSIIDEYKSITINKLNIQGVDFRGSILTSEPLIIHRTIYNTTMELSIILEVGQGTMINPSSIIDADITYGDSNFQFETIIESFEIETQYVSADKPVIIYHIKTMPFDSVLARRTIYGDVYNIVDGDGNKVTMPMLQKKIKKISEINMLLDGNNKDYIKKIVGWNSYINSSDLDKMQEASEEDEFYLKMKEDLKSSYDKYNQYYIDMKYAKQDQPLMAGDIVKQYSIKFLEEEGISLGRIDEGVDIWETDIEEFDTTSLKQIMDDLANASGYVWFVDDKRRINFFKEIEPTGDVKTIMNKNNLEDFIILDASKSIQNYYNKVFIRGGEPYEDVGPDMLDMSGNIKYIKELPVEIMKQKEITGMSGVHGTVHMNDRIHKIKDASELANNLLGKAGRLPHKLEISTNKTHLDILDKIYIDLPDINMVGLGVITNLDIQWILRQNGEEKAETIITVEPITSLSNLQEDWPTFVNKLVMNVNNLNKKVTQIINGFPSGLSGLESITSGDSLGTGTGGNGDGGGEDVDPDPEPTIDIAAGREGDIWLDFTSRNSFDEDFSYIVNNFRRDKIGARKVDPYLGQSIKFIEPEDGSSPYIVPEMERIHLKLDDYYAERPWGTTFAVFCVPVDRQIVFRMNEDYGRELDDFPWTSKNEVVSTRERFGSSGSGNNAQGQDDDLIFGDGFQFYNVGDNSPFFIPLNQSIYDYANVTHNGYYYSENFPQKFEKKYDFQIVAVNSGKTLNDKYNTVITTPEPWHRITQIRLDIIDSQESIDTEKTRLYEFISYQRVLSKDEYKQTYNSLCLKYNKKEWLI